MNLQQKKILSEAAKQVMFFLQDYVNFFIIIIRDRPVIDFFIIFDIFNMGQFSTGFLWKTTYTILFKNTVR